LAHGGANDELIITTGGVERASFANSEIVFNDTSNDVNFRVEGNGDANLLVVNAGSDRVGISTTSPLALFDVDGGDALIHGVSVGRGLGSVATNTVVGNNALDANTTGSNNTAIGDEALGANTTATRCTAVGSDAALSNTTGSSTTAGRVFRTSYKYHRRLQRSHGRRRVIFKQHRL